MLGLDVARLRLQHQADVGGGFVADVLEEGELLLLQELGHALDQLRLRDLVGDLGDDDLVGAALQLLLLPLGADAEGAAAGAVGLDDGLAGFDHRAAGREVRALDEVDQLVDPGVGEFEEVAERVADLGDVVRRDVGGHADRDALRAVGQQVREGGGEDRRLLLGAVVVGAEVDGVLAQPVQHQRRGRRETGLGVAHGGGVIAVDRAEIALAVDHRIADREILRQARHSVVDRGVAMGVVLAHDVADHAGRFLEGGAGV